MKPSTSLHPIPCPPDRSLGEYVSVFTVLAGKLITRLSNGMPDFVISKSAALLVCLHRDQMRTFAITIMGFSVTGGNSSRNDMISRRKSNLPVLSQISKHRLKRKPGSCAKGETFAHLGYIYHVIRDRVTDGSRKSNTDEAGGMRSGSKVISVNLTMSLRRYAINTVCLVENDFVISVRSWGRESLPQR